MLRIADSWHGSDLGLQRQGNEDSYFVRAPLFVVADGMGGAQSGEVASEIAVEAFGDGLPDGDSPSEGLVQIIETANRRIHERSRAEQQRAGMGTTVTAAYVGEDAVTVAHVGDSRCYLLRDGELRRLTVDHSLVGELVRLGKLTEEQAEQHPQRSVITRALGPEPHVQVDVEAFEAEAGDLFMVCSDGLTSMVREDRLSRCWSATSGRWRARPRADRGRQRRRRARQHHGHPVPAGGDRDGGPRGARPPPRGADQDTREYETFTGEAYAGRAKREPAAGPHAPRRRGARGRAQPRARLRRGEAEYRARARSRCRPCARGRSRSRKARPTPRRGSRRAGGAGGCSRPAR